MTVTMCECTRAVFQGNGRAGRGGVGGGGGGREGETKANSLLI